MVLDDGGFRYHIRTQRVRAATSVSHLRNPNGRCCLFGGSSLLRRNCWASQRARAGDEPRGHCHLPPRNHGQHVVILHNGCDVLDLFCSERRRSQSILDCDCRSGAWHADQRAGCSRATGACACHLFIMEQAAVLANFAMAYWPHCIHCYRRFVVCSRNGDSWNEFSHAVLWLKQRGALPLTL